MSIKLMVAVFDSAISRPLRLVALACADFANDDGLVYPSLERLAWKTLYKRRQLQYAMDALEEMGVLEVIAEATPDYPPRYLFHAEYLPARPSYEQSRRGAENSGAHFPTETVSKTAPNPSLDPSVQNNLLLLPTNPSSSKKQSSSTRARAKADTLPVTTIPRALKLTDAMRLRIAAVGCRDPGKAFEAFVDNHTKRQSRWADWEGAVWSTWVRNHAKYECPCQQRPQALRRSRDFPKQERS